MITHVRLALAAFITLCLLGACAGGQKEIVPSPAYAPYVTAYTGGMVGTTSGIRVELTQDRPLVDLNNPLEESPFSFKPALNGKTYWTDNRTLEFRPDSGQLQPGRIYRATFRLDQFAEVEKSMKQFEFSFRVQSRYLDLTFDHLRVPEQQPDEAVATIYLTLSEPVTKERAQQLVRARDSSGNNLHVVIQPTDRADRYQVVVPLRRAESDYQVKVETFDQEGDFKETRHVDFTVPALGVFRLLSTRRLPAPDNGIEATFSSPLPQEQDWNGLFSLSNIPNANLQVMDNIVRFHFGSEQTEATTMRIHEALKDVNGQRLSQTHELAFGPLHLLPQVKMDAEAAILPDAKRLVIPFRAVNLYAVDISIIRIFEHNVLSFLQNNTLTDDNELRRLGRLIHKQTLHLAADKSKNVHQWEEYTVDLSGIIQEEPGAIYRIILSFNRAYSAYPSSERAEAHLSLADTPSGNVGLTPVTGNTPNDEEQDKWDIPNAYYYYTGGMDWDWEKYEWEERNNPNHVSYYMDSSLPAKCNVIASNLGLTVKSNSLHHVWATVSRLTDTKPVDDATVTLYNYQLQPIANATTDSQGFAELQPKGVPFLAVAESEGEKTYVRMVNGESLSLSRFDTEGKLTEKGLKGFVYGERGVWRPGDTLHVAFILEDREKRIPDTHPVTLEVYNARGQYHCKQISTKGLNGFYAFDVPTHASDPTGLWHAYVKVGGTSFHKSLRIETVKPNRLKIELSLLDKRLQASQQTANATLTSTWLTGARASGLKAKTEISLSKVNTQFPSYKNFTFNNPATDFISLQTTAFTAQLNEEGKANVALKLPPASDAPGLLNATLTTRVYEPGGDASIHTMTLPYSPFNAYVGIDLHQDEDRWLETDTNHRFDIVTLRADGTPVECTDLEYKIYRLDWSWWWESQNESFSTYVNNHNITPVANGSLNTTGGRAHIDFQVNYPDWGRYLVYVKDKKGGHATGGIVYIDWPEWRGRSTKTDPDHVKMLTFSLDRESYQVGDQATVVIPASAGGRALVSIENGSTVLKREWVEVSPGQDTHHSIHITPDMAPNAYLHISLLQPHSQTVNDLPIRLYGVQPILVNNPNTHLQPNISLPEVLRPQTDFQVTVSEQTGKPMTYTLALVDEGLLDLTNFRTPDPWQEFYTREALGIRTWDMFDFVLGASAGQFGAMFSTGGDATLNPAAAKTNRFNPVVKFIGPFHIGKGQKQTHTLRLPMYVGSVRAMVVAGEDGAYGMTEKTAAVRNPLMLLSTLPRVLSVNETINVPVNVFAMEKNVRDVSVTIETTGCDLAVDGQRTRSLRFSEPGDQLTRFSLKTGKQTGKATVRITAEGGGKRASETIEIDVRNPNPAVTLHTRQWVKPGQTATLPYSVAGSQSDNAEVTLEVSRIPSVDFSRRIDFLHNYHHQCTEQLTSKALPLLFIDRFKEMTADETAQTKQSIQEAIRQLYTRQLPNGGFTYWPGNATADEWVTSYAGMFLTLAKEEGYAVSANVLNKWKAFQRAAALNWQPHQQVSPTLREQGLMQQTFRLYTLALHGSPEQGAMNRLKEYPELPPQARWNLAAAYALTGRTQPAEELVFNQPTEVAPYTTRNTTYGTALRDEAMILETLVWMKRTDAALEVARKVSTKLAKEEQFDTQTTAFSLMAMSRLAGLVSGKLDFTWTWNGKRQADVSSGKAGFTQSLSTPPAQGKVEINNRGEGAVEAVIASRVQLLDDTLPALSKGISLTVKYTYLNNDQPISAETLKQGTDFQAVVTVSNTSLSTDYAHLALTHILPAGWEIYNTRPTAENESGNYSYQDIRDDRVLTYFDLPRGQQKTFVVRLQATYAGNFVLPAIACEDMYDTSVQARTQAGRTHVEE